MTRTMEIVPPHFRLHILDSNTFRVSLPENRSLRYSTSSIATHVQRDANTYSNRTVVVEL